MKLATVAILGLIVLASAVPLLAQEKAAPGPKITYDDHVRPILREHCFTCHNQNSPKGGLSLETYAKTMEGGSSGEVVLAGDTSSSRLYALVSHAEEPFMPPMADKLADAKLETIKKWIEGGALENSGSIASMKKKKSLDLGAAAGAGKPEGPAAMPERVWKQPLVVTERRGAIAAIAASPWAPLFALGGHKQVSLYHSESGRLLGVLPFPEGTPHVVRFSRNGALLLVAGGRGGQTGLTAIFDVKSGKRVATVGEEFDAVLAADISSDHSLVALGGPGKIVRIYSVQTGEKLHEIKKHTDWIMSVAFSHDGVLLATGDRSGGLFVWEADTAREYLNLRGHNGSINSVSWRPDSNLLASGSEDGTAKLWEMNDGNQVKSWNAHGGGVLSVTYAPDGKIATAGRDNTAKLWDGNGGAVRTLPASSEDMLHVVFGHDSQRVLTADWLGQARVWGLTGDAPLLELGANPPPYEKQVAALKSLAEQAQQALTAVANELRPMEESLGAKASALAAADQAAKASEMELMQAVASKTAAETSLAKVNELMAATQPALAAAESSFKAAPEDKILEEIASAARVTHEKVVKAKGELESRMPMLVEKQKQLDAKLAAAKADMARIAKEKADLESLVAAKRAAVDEAKGKATARAQELAEIEAEFVAFRTLPQQLREQASKATAEAAEANARATALATEVSAAEKAAVERATEVKAMAEKVAQLQAELAKLGEGQKAAEAVVREKKAAMDAAKQAAERAVEAAQRAEQEAAELEKLFGKGGA